MNCADDDGFLEVIIYIVIMVIMLAASVYRNYDKRRKEEQRKAQGDLYSEFPEVETEPSFEEEIFSEEPEYYENPFNKSSADAPEITGTHQPVVPEPEVQTISSESLLDRPVSEVESGKLLDSIENANVDLEQEAAFEESVNLSNDILDGDLAKSEIRDAPSEEELVEEFDVKKAIIYSEIINRKYV